MSYNLGTAQGNIRIEYDSRGVARARDDMGRFVSMSSLMGDSVDRDTDKVSRKFQMFGKELAKVTALILAAGAASNIMSSAIGGIVLVGQSLVPVLTASLATLPGLLLAGAAAGVVLKLALQGVADAAKAAFSQDAGKFAEAIKNLAPEAQNAAKSLYALVTAAKPVQKAIQNAFFAATAPLVDALVPAIKSLEPLLVTAAGGFNAIFKAVLGAFGSTAFVDAFGKSLQGVADFLTALAPGFVPLITGFSQLAGQAGKFFASFGEKAAGALAKFGEFLGQIDLDQMWATASVALENFGELLSGLGSILGSIVGAFTGATAAADDLAGPTTTLANSLNVVVAKMAEFLSSAEGSAILGALASAMSAVATAGGDVLLSLLQNLSPIFVALAPGVVALARALGAILTSAMSALQPLLTAVAQALSNELGAALPRLVESFTRLAPVIGQVAAVFGTVLGGVLGVLIPVIVRIADVMSQALLPILTALIPYIEKWGETWIQVANDSLPQVLALIDQLGPVLADLAPLISLGAMAIISLLIPAMKLIPPIVTLIVGSMTVVMAIWRVVGSVVQWLGSLISGVWSSISGVTTSTWTNVANSVRGAIQNAQNAVSSAINAIKSTISTLSAIPGQVGGYFRAMVTAATGAIGNLLGAVRAIPGQIRGALGGLSGMLFGAGQDVIQGFINGIKSMASAAANAARAAVAGVPGAIKGALGIGSPAKVIIPLGRFTGEGFIVGLLQMSGKIAAAAAAMAALVPATVATTFETNGMANGAAYTSAAGAGIPPTTPATASADGGAGLTVNQTINTLPHQTPGQIAAISMQQLAFSLRTGTNGLGEAT